MQCSNKAFIQLEGTVVIHSAGSIEAKDSNDNLLSHPATEIERSKADRRKENFSFMNAPQTLKLSTSNN